jgi:hypothetical protein
MKKTIYISLALAAFALAGCQSPLELSKAPRSPAGTGTFTLEIGGVHAGRTILPATIQSDFAAYTLAFSGNGAPQTVDRTAATLGNPVTLSVGTWDLTVTAYMDSAKTKPAARGSITEIVIGGGAVTSRSLELTAIIEAGATGTFRWNIGYPEMVTSAGVTITPLDPATGTAEQTLYFTGGTPTANADNAASPLTLNTGYYRVVFNLSAGTLNAGREEYLHIYQNMTSAFEYTFTSGHFDTTLVTSGGDSETTPGTLRYAVTNAAPNSVIVIDSAVGTIYLENQLRILKNLTIQGNGVTITRAASWIPTNLNLSQMLRFDNTAACTVKFSRVHFKDGRANGGAAILNWGSIVYLESCVFSGNTNPNSSGGALMQSQLSGRGPGTLVVKGCTFYNNSADSGSGAVSVLSGTATLTGNLFYGNTAPAVYASGGTVTSGGYNVVDAVLGTGTTQSGFAPATGDRAAAGQPISLAADDYLRPFPTGDAANVIPTLPADYPTVDFYGNNISGSYASAGAVQGKSGYYLTLSVNDEAKGSVSALPLPDADGLIPVSATVTITATPAPGYDFLYWAQDGSTPSIDTPFDDDRFILTMSANTSVQAIFGKKVMVTDFTDTAPGADPIPGTLRHALINAQDGDYIVLSGVTPGITTITLASGLPDITKSITIQGNGVIFQSFWPGGPGSVQMRIFDNYDSSRDITVNISRIQFKRSRSTQYGAAIYNRGETLNVESCIFWDNTTIATGTIIMAGAIYSEGTLTVKGCTFYQNKGEDAGAVYVYHGTATLTGNLFYENGWLTPLTHVAGRNGNDANTAVTSGGYNVVDGTVAITDRSGFAAATGDTTLSLLVSGRPFASPSSLDFSNGDGPFTFVPAAGLRSLIPSSAAHLMPERDFYGELRTFPGAPGAVN